MKQTVIKHIAGLMLAIEICQQKMQHCCQDEERHHWQSVIRTHKANIDLIAREYLPSGSGFDAGTQVDLFNSKLTKIRLTTRYHHMNENGIYDGWTGHNITLRPTFLGARITAITGKNRNDIKGYIGETILHALEQEVDL
jgi:hypothetical protein